MQVSGPFVSTATWRLANTFSNSTIPCRFSDGINGRRLNKDMYKVFSQKSAKIPAQILWICFLKLKISSVDLDLPSFSFVINKNNEILPFDITKEFFILRLIVFELQKNLNSFLLTVPQEKN